MTREWRTIKLGDVLKVQNGYAFDSKAFNSSKGMPLIRIRDLKEGTETETRFSGVYDEKYVVKAGDLLIGMDGEFGCYEWKGSPALLNQRVCRFQGFAFNLAPRFLFYGVNSYLKAIEDVTGYATVKHISSKQILGIEFPLPPLPEQQRIVGILDEAFEGIATAKANAEKNLQNARDLFESHLQSVFAQRGKGWVEKRLGDVCRTGAGGTPLKSKKEYYEGGNIPWLMSGEVSQGEILSATKFITREGLENSSARMFPKNTVLVAMYGATAGAVGILRFEAATNQAICGIFPDDKFVPEFLYYVLLSKKRELVDQATGNAQPNISQIKIKNTEVPVIALLEQRCIVTTLDSLSNETRRLDSIYQQKLAALEVLKKSLLHQAFIGEL